MSDTTLRFDLLANDRASKVFDTVGRSAADTESKFAKVGRGLATVGKAAAGGLAIGAAAGAVALVGMTKNAIEDEAAQRKLALGLKNSVGATDAQVASIEDWISKAGVATGVTDDEMRPAFQRLVESTGSISKAQKEMSIAMDVSAGTGKSLETVSSALMKANNGTTASLSKLGLKTKDAEGNTLSLKDALATMSDTFKGQAEARADSMQGKMDRLKLIFDETKETIGAKLIPILSSMADWFLNKGMPAIGQVGDYLEAHFVPVLQKVGDWIANTVVPAVQKFAGEMQSGQGAGGKFADAIGKMRDALQGAWDILKPVLEFMANNKTVVATFAGVILTVVGVTKAWTAAQVLLNSAWLASPVGLVVLAIAALAAGLVYAYKKSETFRDVVNKAFEIVGNAGRSLWNDFLQPALHFIVEGIGKVIEGAADMLDALSHIPGFGWAKDAADKMHAAADAAKDVADNINKIPSSKSVNVTVTVNTSAIDKVQHQLDTLGGTYGRVGAGDQRAKQTETYSFDLGSLFAKNFAGGIKDKTKLALDAVKSLTEKALGKLADLKAKAAEIRSSIANAMTGALDVANLGAIGEDGVKLNVTDQLSNFAATAGQFATALAQAAAKGLNADLIAKVANLGPTQGLTAAQALAAMSAAEVASANASLDAVDKYANQLGHTVLTTTSLPEDIARQQGILDTLSEIKKDLRENPGNISFTVNDATDPDAVVRAIRKWLRQNGKKVGDI